MTDSAFEAWYGEIEGFSVRAERLTAPKDELEAAFEAGAAAGRERAAKVADGIRDEVFAAHQHERAYVAECIAASIRNPSLKEQDRTP